MRRLAPGHAAWLIILIVGVAAGIIAVTAEPQEFRALVLPGEQRPPARVQITEHNHPWRGCPVCDRPLELTPRPAANLPPSRPTEKKPLTIQERLIGLHDEIDELRRTLKKRLNQCSDKAVNLQMWVAELERRSKVSPRPPGTVKWDKAVPTEESGRFILKQADAAKPAENMK